MVGFATLLLGLVLGVHRVELVVADAVARVELRLDGEVVGTLREPPWELAVDFGPDLAPHLLEAIAYDRLRAEVGRARQPVNLPRNPVEARLSVEPRDEGRASIARLTWESLVGDDSPRVELTFNGQPLQVEDPREFALPPYDPELLHLLRAELEFAGAATSSVELVFGGAFADRSSTRLSAFPVLTDRPKKVPRPEQMEGWFAAGDARPAVVGLEKGPAEIVVVRSPAAGEHLLGLHRGRPVTVFLEPTATSDLRAAARWNWRVQFLWPVTRPSEGARRFDLFPHSQIFTEEDGDLVTLVSAIDPPRTPGRLRLADAIAVAGVTAATGNHRRAVVLVLGEDADQSDITAAQARAFLDRLRVPLFVWRASDTKAAGDAWGEAADVSTRTKLERATRELEKTLDHQRVVWLDGYHLPHRIRVTARARGLQPVAGEGRR